MSSTSSMAEAAYHLQSSGLSLRMWPSMPVGRLCHRYKVLGGRNSPWHPSLVDDCRTLRSSTVVGVASTPLPQYLGTISLLSGSHPHELNILNGRGSISLTVVRAFHALALNHVRDTSHPPCRTLRQLCCGVSQRILHRCCCHLLLLQRVWRGFGPELLNCCLNSLQM